MARSFARLCLASLLAVAASAAPLAQDEDFTLTGCVQRDADEHFLLRTYGGDEVTLQATDGVSFSEHVGHTVRITARIVTVNSDGDPDQVRVSRLVMVASGCY